MVPDKPPAVVPDKPAARSRFWSWGAAPVAAAKGTRGDVPQSTIEEERGGDKRDPYRLPAGMIVTPKGRTDGRKSSIAKLMLEKIDQQAREDESAQDVRGNQDDSIDQAHERARRERHPWEGTRERRESPGRISDLGSNGGGIHRNGSTNSSENGSNDRNGGRNGSNDRNGSPGAREGGRGNGNGERRGSTNSAFGENAMKQQNAAELVFGQEFDRGFSGNMSRSFKPKDGTPYDPKAFQRRGSKDDDDDAASVSSIDFGASASKASNPFQHC